MSLFLVGPLTRLIRSMGETFTDEAHGTPALGLLLAAVFIMYTGGAYLKRWPLQARLVKRSPPPENSFAGCLSRGGSFVVLLLHLVLFLIMTIVIVADYEMKEFTGSICFIIGLACIPTAVTIMALIPPKNLSAASWRASWQLEFVADLALFFSTLVIVVIWNLLAENVLAGRPIGEVSDLFGNLAFLFVFVLPMFVMFYIAPRVLYLAEDYMYRWTWVAIILAVLPLAKRIVFGG